MNVRAIFAAAVLTTLVACPPSLKDPERFRLFDAGTALSDASIDSPPVVCPTDIPEFFMTSCGASGCHGTVAAAKLDLVTPDVRLRLRSVPSVGDPNMLLIDPTDASKSALYLKMKTPPPFGLPMPPATPLPNGTADCFLSWLAEVPTPADAGGDGGGDGSLDAPSD